MIQAHSASSAAAAAICSKNKTNTSVAKKRKFKPLQIVNEAKFEKALGVKINEYKAMMDDCLSRVLGVGKPKVVKPLHDPEAPGALVLYTPNEEEDNENKQDDSDSEDEENEQESDNDSDSDSEKENDNSNSNASKAQVALDKKLKKKQEKEKNKRHKVPIVVGMFLFFIFRFFVFVTKSEPILALVLQSMLLLCTILHKYDVDTNYIYICRSKVIQSIATSSTCRC